MKTSCTSVHNSVTSVERSLHFLRPAAAWVSEPALVHLHCVTLNWEYLLNVFIALRGTLHKCVLYIKLWECGTLYIVMHGTETSVLYSKFEFTLYSTFDFLVLQWSFLIPRALYLVSSELWAYHIRGQTFQFLYAHHDHACCGRSQLWKF